MCQGLSAFFLPHPDTSAPNDLRVPGQQIWLSKLIRDLVRSYGKGKLNEFLRNVVLPGIYLNGRNENDMLLFLEDCFNSVTPTGTVIKISLEGSRGLTTCKVSGKTSRQTNRLHLELGMGSGPRKHPAQIIHGLRSGALRLLQPFKCFSGGSSDVVNVAWSPDGSKFALGTTTLNDAYNRPGNLVLGCAESMKVKVLDGHKVDRPERQREATLDNQIRCTVTGVDFSDNGALMYSSSYDHTIKLWETKKGGLLGSFDLKSIVVTMSVSKPHRTIAASAKSGNVTALRFSENGSRVCHHFPATKKGLYASTLLWADELNPHWLLAGYDTDHKASVAGDCLILDASTGQKVHTIRPSTGGHYDMFLHHQSGFLATGVSATPSKSSNTYSFVRVYSLANQSNHARKVLEFDSFQKDINVVTISYVAPSESSVY
jgi:WD40 repeat protein